MGPLNLSSLQKRLLSGLILGPLVVLAIFAGGRVFTLMVAGFAATALYEWIRLSLKIRNKKYIYVFLGSAYVLFGFYYLYALGANFPLFLSFSFLALVWSSDIGAYFSGKKFRGPKMAPKISPNKTWSGFAGAILFPAFIGVIFTYVYIFYDTGMESWPSRLFFPVAGIVVGTVGQLGDLVVSFAKRRSGIKDSGDIIPGHGGVLDRVDSMMLAAPVFYFLVLYAVAVNGGL